MKKLSSKKAKLFVFVIVLLVIAVCAGFYVTANKVPSGYVQAPGYHQPHADEITCDAIMPTCGDCSMGKVVDGKCYVPKNSPFASQQSQPVIDGDSNQDDTRNKCLSLDCGTN